MDQSILFLTKTGKSNNLKRVAAEMRILPLFK